METGSPGSGYVESFHSRFRDKCLTREVFGGLRDSRAITQAWKNDYNYRRPHSALGFQTPAEFTAVYEVSTSA